MEPSLSFSFLRTEEVPILIVGREQQQDLTQARCDAVSAENAVLISAKTQNVPISEPLHDLFILETLAPTAPRSWSTRYKTTFMPLLNS